MYAAPVPPAPRRQEEAEFQTRWEEAQASPEGAGLPSTVRPPIAGEMRNRAPGLHRNFYDIPTTDFKRPHGSSGVAASPAAPEATPDAGAAAPAGAGSVGAGSGAAASRRPYPDSPYPNGMPATATPGREEEHEAFVEYFKELEAFQAQAEVAAPPPAYAPPFSAPGPPGRAGGRQLDFQTANNFYEVSQSDFRQPYRMSRPEGAPRRPPGVAGGPGAPGGPGGRSIV